MVLFRWLSLTLIVLALMLLGADIVSTLEAGSGVIIRSLDKVLLLFNMDLKPWVQNTFSPSVANVLLSILSSPAWVTLGILGIVFSFIAPARRERAPEHAPAPAEH